MNYPALDYKSGGARKDACYHKVKSRYSVWPSAYASGALSKCRKVGADNWGNKKKAQDSLPPEESQISNLNYPTSATVQNSSLDWKGIDQTLADKNADKMRDPVPLNAVVRTFTDQNGPGVQIPYDMWKRTTLSKYNRDYLDPYLLQQEYGEVVNPGEPNEMRRLSITPIYYDPNKTSADFETEMINEGGQGGEGGSGVINRKGGAFNVPKYRTNRHGQMVPRRWVFNRHNSGKGVQNRQEDRGRNTPRRRQDGGPEERPRSDGQSFLSYRRLHNNKFSGEGEATSMREAAKIQAGDKLTFRNVPGSRFVKSEDQYQAQGLTQYTPEEMASGVTTQHFKDGRESQLGLHDDAGFRLYETQRLGNKNRRRERVEDSVQWHHPGRDFKKNRIRKKLGRIDDRIQNLHDKGKAYTRYAGSSKMDKGRAFSKGRNQRFFSGLRRALF